MASLSLSQIIEKERQRDLGLVQNEMIHIDELIGTRREKRTAGDHLDPERLAPGNDGRSSGHG
jgi:hypothetical protein